MVYSASHELKPLPRPCRLSKTGECKYGGNKYYNYGPFQGTASYCRFAKKWVCDLGKCPKTSEGALYEQ